MSNQGYSSIPQNEEDGRGTSNDPLLVNRSKGSSKQWIRRNLAFIAISLILLVIVAIVLFASFLPESSLLPKEKRPFTINSGVSELTMEAGRNKCQAIKSRQRTENVASEARENPRADPKQKSILLKNAVVWDGQGNVLENVDIYIENGVIRKVEKDIQAPEGIQMIDVLGHVVSPGLVDMHSHLGVFSWPNLHGTDDTNEETSPITPFVRSLDAFNPSDNAIRIVSSGGVTTALVLPGSGNLMGGEAYAFKLRPVSTLSNEDMLVQYNIDESDTKWRWMKMACGENPKNVYGSRNQMPSTRLGEAYLFRKEFARAQKLMHEQDDWCRAADNTGSRFNTAFPEDLSLETLVALLRGEVRLNVHCYETHDIEAMVRHSLEFDFNISAFHHALDAYRIPSVIKRARNNITVATFADNWGYKKEAFQAIPQAPKILFDAGIPLALKSDHPVLNSQHLVFEAAKSTHYGLPAQEAFKAVTSTPAHAIGLGHRVGSLKVGYDADLVIWDREPLDLGATPLQVFIDGIPQFDDRTIEPVSQKTTTKAIKKENAQKVNGTRSFILRNAGYSFLGQEPKEGPLDVIVQEGSLVCSGSDCSHVSFTENVPEYDLQGGYVLPGLIGVGSSLGLVEIPSEKSTGDGKARASKSQDPKDILYTVDGLKLGTRHLEEAYKGGVLTSITAPMSDNVVIGISAAFKTGADSVLTEGTIISPAVALHLQIGNGVKSESFPTISSQISFIRQLLTDNLNAQSAYGQAARGEIPTVISAVNKDEIASLIILKRDHFPQAKFVILGGTEAHLVASHLAEADIPVVIRPTLCTPSTYDSLHCLPGAPLTNGTLAHVLHSHGVKMAVGISGDGFARNLAWDAGWLSATSPHESQISEIQAIQLVTSNIRDIYGLGQSLSESEFIVYSGNPFDLQSRLVFIHSENGLTAY
ncbi:hypothetical protein CU098_011594 [Rhizopus stolonifer]|uniref:Amidohydrolase-related domain-containing protein n=1 Tax=Rhizopus stolonifer TaxID=4846 RepID=A0A367KNS9_RHIST|nr:hypothetical protein CU098_011594 [Rhizopus stolonifer]